MKVILGILSILVIPVAVAFLLVNVSGQDTQAHAPSGAIWTTEVDGVPVNGNIYDDKDDVYLNGGPLRPGAAGLPPSTYVFQVTDPSGSDLLSQDKAKCRVFTVGVNGRIDGVVDSTIFNTNGNGSCTHAIGTDVDTGATTIRLMPYANTPNPGGEYKAWITRLGDFAQACQGGQTFADIKAALNLNPNGGSGLSSCAGSFGFVPGHTKTDNYKVRVARMGSVAGLKYYDASNNGQLDSEQGIAGWPIKICRITKTNGGPPGSIAVGACAETFTSATGAYGFVGLGKGEYCIREARARDVDTDPPVSPFDDFDWIQTEPTNPASSVVFANGCDSGGTFNGDLMNGVYSVIINADDHTGLNFGNVAFELAPVSGGLTWGYWKTHTGTGETPPQAPQDPIYVNPLGIDLGSSAGTHLNVETPEDADTVFAADGSGTADEPPWPSPQEISDLCSAGDCRTNDFAHPAGCEGDCHEQLVVQLLALKLNILSGEFSGDAIYINPGDPNSGKTVNEIIADADAALSAWFDGGSFDFHDLHATINAINENASSGVLFSVVILPSPPSPLCFVGFSCP